MPDFTVKQRGLDSSGRPILMTTYMWGVWQQILADPRVAPFAHKLTIVQGAFMERLGGGAEASAGVHNKAGCLDVRTWNLTADELDIFILVSREHAFPFYRRDERHGMTPHAHGILGTDSPLDSGAAWQWTEYLAGRDALASRGPDYEERPDPLVLKPPTKDWFDMATEADLRRIVREEIKAALEKEQANGNTVQENIRLAGKAAEQALSKES